MELEFRREVHVGDVNFFFFFWRHKFESPQGIDGI